MTRTSLAAARATVAATCVALTACATNPATNAAATGALLRVEARSGTYQYDADVETGHTVTTDSGGNATESVNYERQTLTANYLDWKLYEGDQEIDEQDYFRIAGDTAAYDEIKRTRAWNERLQQWGGAAAVVGTAAAVAIYAFAPKGQEGREQGDLSPGWRNAAMLTFSVGQLGIGAWLWGEHAMPGKGSTKHHMDLDRTSRAAAVVCHNGRCASNPDAPQRANAAAD